MVFKLVPTKSSNTWFNTTSTQSNKSQSSKCHHSTMNRQTKYVYTFVVVQIKNGQPLIINKNIVKFPIENVYSKNLSYNFFVKYLMVNGYVILHYVQLLYFGYCNHQTFVFKIEWLVTCRQSHCNSGLEE